MSGIEGSLADQQQNNVTQGGSDWWADLWASEDSHEVVLKRVARDGSEETVGTMHLTADEFSDFEDLVLAVKEQYGGGKFVMYRRGESGRFLPGSRKRFSCSGPVKDLNEAEGLAGIKRDAPSELSQLGAMMLQMQQAAEQRMESMMAAFMQVQEKNANQFEMVKQTAAFLRDIGGAPVTQKSPIEMLKEIKEGADFIGLTGAKDDVDLTPLMMDLVGGIRETIAESQKTERLRIAARLKGQQKTQGAGKAPSVDTENNEQIAVERPVGMMGFIALLDQLVSAAEADADSVEVAQRVWESAKADAKTVAQLKSLLDRDDALEVLQSVNKKVGQHFEWFENLANAVLNLMEGGSGGNNTTASSGATAEKPKAKTAARGRGRAANAKADAGTRTARKPVARSKGASVGAGR